MAFCFICTEADRLFLESVPADAPADDPRRTGENYTLHGPTKGYLGGNQLIPVRRAGGTSGNPDPCYIVGTQVLTGTDDDGNLIFGTAVAYLSGLPQKDSNIVPPFPGPYVP